MMIAVNPILEAVLLVSVGRADVGTEVGLEQPFIKKQCAVFVP